MSSPEGTGPILDLTNLLWWEDLSKHLWAATAKRITAIRDYISFRYASRSLRSAATFANFETEFHRLPGLMYTRIKIGGLRILGNNFKSYSYFLELESRNVNIMNFPPHDGIPYLSWSEWILHVPISSADISLRHFLRQSEKFVLPSLDTFPECQVEYVRMTRILLIKKMVLSERPTIDSDFVVMVIWGSNRQLGFCRRQDPSWTVTDRWTVPFSDIIYHNRKLYALDTLYRVVECDVHGPNPIQLRQVFFLPGVYDSLRSTRFYNLSHMMVAPSGKFLVVFRNYTRAGRLRFRVFEFDLRNGSHGVIHHLGNKALFLGLNSSICLHVSASTNINRNCIYFTDPYGQLSFSITGSYNLSTRTSKLLIKDSSTDIYLPPTWILPSF